jgi:hypothetical protein
MNLRVHSELLEANYFRPCRLHFNLAPGLSFLLFSQVSVGRGEHRTEIH